MRGEDARRNRCSESPLMEPWTRVRKQGAGARGHGVGCEESGVAVFKGFRTWAQSRVLPRCPPPARQLPTHGNSQERAYLPAFKHGGSAPGPYS